MCGSYSCWIVVALTAEGFYEKPPYPAKIQENKNILETIREKVHKGVAHLMSACTSQCLYH
jgi:hypothetical protein